MGVMRLGIVSTADINRKVEKTAWES